MLQVGKMNSLKIKTIQSAGVYLDTGGATDLFLPKRSVPDTSQVGDAIEVFVYVDKENALRATTDRKSVV